MTTPLPKAVRWSELDSSQQRQLLSRPALANADSLADTVAAIIQRVRSEGDNALKALSTQFDKVELQQLRVDASSIDDAEARLGDDVKQALQQAASNIRRFHEAQKPQPIQVETQPGVVCEQHCVAMRSVGLYVPGGSAPLPSTVLMLAIPAQIAGCQQITLCSPPPVADEILYAARLCGVTTIAQVGGAQAIAAMAYGTDSIAKVDKIFGPGNAFVTEAKRQVSNDISGAAIDMPAGPSEVLVLADDSANPGFVAADLLSQAEHGPDSQVILATPSESLANAVATELAQQLAQLPRAEIAAQALANSRLIVTDTLEQAIEVSNYYGPEHLIVQTADPRALLPQLRDAGSIFLGPWSPESVGDYASGTNHVLPTYGYTRNYSSLGLADFMKRFTVQELSADGLRQLGPTVATLADAEQLAAHGNAVRLRLDALSKGESKGEQP
ncbi:histidinol dehydrogenase [bacterium SCSIO 12696]|nr:histidinol dehydrogenase [bacterium SCSIO 12696]